MSYVHLTKRFGVGGRGFELNPSVEMASLSQGAIKLER